MKLTYKVTINSVKSVSELPNYWTTEKLKQLLENLEFDGITGISDDQLRDYATMVLQDLDCADAARVLIDLTLGNQLSNGKKQNISEEMESDRLWEEYPDLSCHEPIFNAQVLLSQAFPSTQQPEVNLIEATLQPIDTNSASHLKSLSQPNPPEAFIVRCLAAASAVNAILIRLFEDQINGDQFPEAEHIVWQVQSEFIQIDNEKFPALKLTLYSPIRWTETLEEDSTATYCERD